MDQNNQYLSENESEDLKRIIYKYLHYWPWFAGAVLVMVILAGLYLRYSSEIYQTNAEIKILDAKDSGLDLSGLQGASTLFEMNEVNLENETQIITSRRLLTKVINNLDLNTRYYTVGQIKSSELWKNDLPFKVNWKLPDTLIAKNEPAPLIYVDFVSNSNFQISTEETELSKKFTYGNQITVDNYTFEIVLNPEFSGELTPFLENSYSFQYISTEKLLQSFVNILTVQPVGEQSEILNITIKGENQAKNEAILNELVGQFNQDGIEDKRLISKRTGEFIEKRLIGLTKELDTVETGLVDYKQEADLVTLESSATQLFSKEGSAEMKRFEVETQLAVTKSFKDELINGEPFSLLPANIGIESPSINELTATYNEKVLTRNKLLISSTAQNPMIVNLEERLNGVKQNIIGSVNSYVNSLQISLQNLEQREAISSSKLNTIPKKEKRIRMIERQQAIKEKLYLFLLQKREEAALQYAITSPTIKIVDYAYTQPQPISPKKKIILLAALILGLLIPFGILYLRFLLNTKVQNKEQVQKIVGDIPIVAEVPQLEKNSGDIIRPNDRTVLAEAFRILRTNINYFKPTNKKESEVIYVTSTTKGEGKTFTAVNLAITLASAQKKVALIGCDLRNPQLHIYLKRDKNRTGVSSYLFDKNVGFDDLILKDPLKYGNLDIALSGNIPPNPAELLLNGRFEQLLEEAKARYDYVVVDTAPTILVTDTFLISPLADTIVYLIRAGHTDLRLLEHIKDVRKNKKLKNLGLVINGLDEKGHYGYNYGYGYGYDEDQLIKSKYKFWKRS